MKITDSNQRGFSVLGLAVVLLLLALLILFGVQQRQQRELRQLRAAQHYYYSYNQTMSALAWAEQLGWQDLMPAQWYCQQSQSLGLKACLKQLPKKQVAIMRAQNGDVELYRLYYLKAGNNLYPLLQQASQWLDYCPLAQDECDE